MSNKLFTKFIPLSEAEYREYLDAKNKHIKSVQQELARPAVAEPLVLKYDEKQRVLFNPTSNPELQEKRFNELTHILNNLKKDVIRSNPPARLHTLPTLPSAAAQHRATQLFENLGPQVWNENNELVIEGESIPGSSRNVLMEFAATDWRNKFTRDPPVGGSQLIQLLKDKNIPESNVGAGIRSRLKLPIIGYAASAQTSDEDIPCQEYAKFLREPTSRAQTIGENILKSNKKFRRFMRAKHTPY